MNEYTANLNEKDTLELLKEENAVLRDKLEEANKRCEQLKKVAVKYKEEAAALDMDLQEADRDSEFLRGKLAVYDRLLDKWLKDVK